MSEIELRFEILKLVIQYRLGGTDAIEVGQAAEFLWDFVRSGNTGFLYEDDSVSVTADQCL